MSRLLQHARSNGYAIPAFNFDSFDVLFGVLDASREVESPVIVQITEPAAAFLGVEDVVSLVRNFAARSGLPVALHLDHGENLETLERCFSAGFTSAMFDGSTLELEDNIAQTTRALTIARRYGASLEAEIGHVGTATHGTTGVETETAAMLTTDESARTRVDELRLFCERVDVDALAISIGSCHGLREQSQGIDLDLLRSISAAVDKPLVLHGSSGVRGSDLKQAICLGICKTNVETELRVTFRSSLEQVLMREPDNIKPRRLMAAVRDSIKERAVSRYKLCGSAGAASGAPNGASAGWVS